MNQWICIDLLGLTWEIKDVAIITKSVRSVKAILKMHNNIVIYNVKNGSMYDAAIAIDEAITTLKNWAT